MSVRHHRVGSASVVDVFYFAMLFLPSRRTLAMASVVLAFVIRGLLVSSHGCRNRLASPTVDNSFSAERVVPQRACATSI